VKLVISSGRDLTQVFEDGFGISRFLSYHMGVGDHALKDAVCQTFFGALDIGSCQPEFHFYLL
jgi:hypothetical protein